MGIITCDLCLVRHQLRMRIYCTVRQRRTLVLEQLLSLLPYSNILPIIQLQKARQERSTECFGRFPREQRWQVINANDRQWQVTRSGWKLDWDCRAIKSCVDVVDWYRIVGICCVAGHIAYYTEFAAVG